MADVVFVLIVIGFLALCVAYVRGCDRIVASGQQAADSAADGARDGAMDSAIDSAMGGGESAAGVAR